MNAERYSLSPPSLEELAEKLKKPLADNYEQTTVAVVECPDLREEPFHLATEGLSGSEKACDVGGQPNLFPYPRLETKWDMRDIARVMEMSSSRGSLIGAGAGPFHLVGRNCELVPNFSWKDGFDHVDNRTRFAQIRADTGAPSIEKSPSLECALMINLYGSDGEKGSVLKISAKKRKGEEKSFTECIRKALYQAYGDSQTISLGGVFLIKTGKARYHIMPDFPSEAELPFRDPKQLNDWLTYHDFSVPIVCCSVLHSADPGKKIGLRLEHTHGYSPTGEDAGGHYHYEVENAEEDVEYEAYFNTAKSIYRVEKPAVTLDRDLHD